MVVRQKQFNLLVYGKGSIKNRVGRSAKYFFFSILRVDILEKKHFSQKTKKKKTLIVSVRSIYSLRDKVEEHSRKIIQN